MNMRTPPHSLDEHREHIHEIVRLKLWFVWNWLHNHPDESFSNVIRKRVDIIRKTDIHPGPYGDSSPDFSAPAWLRLEQAAEGICGQTRGDANAARFETEAFDLFRPSLDAGVEQHYARTLQLDHDTWQCGSLGYSKPRDGAPTTVCFHITNAIRPQSIFHDRSYLPACFLDLLARSAVEYGADAIETGTWLNSHPRFLALFPESWQENMSQPNHEVRWSYAFWGQFVNARGLFNAKTAGMLRKSGEFPYAYRSSHCTGTDMRRHLHKHLRCP